MNEMNGLENEMKGLGSWYHRVELPNGEVTPGTRDQSLVFDLFASRVPQDMTGMTVLDLGSNACGLTLEFARRGATVVAIELWTIYILQAELVLREHGLRDQVEIVQGDVYGAVHLDRTFDIVCYVGLSYHLRYPQLALDMLGRLCAGSLLTSTQTVGGDSLTMSNRARHDNATRSMGDLYGYEPTETLFLDMIAHAGFKDPELVSTAPHLGETEDRICGNRSYFFANAPDEFPALPFVDASFMGKPQHSPAAQPGIDPFTEAR
jgi:hypothetical protein